MTPSASEPSLTQHKVTVLLVDDQPIIGEAVRRMLAGEDDIVFHYCKDATQALARAKEIGPTVILQDLVMPEIDGLSLVKQFREDEVTRETPMIVLSTKEEPKIKAEAFGLGANDYIVKLPDRLELLARIRHHSKGYIALLQRNEAYRALQVSQKLLAKDVAQAAKYVYSLLPDKLKKGDIRTDWRFIPSAELGGDSFGYDWIDEDHFAFYLLDVSGHGVGAALLSVSALNALRSQSLPQTDFRHPDQVLTALNKAFPMEQQNGLFFTIWYGIYHRPTRRLDYAGGGHPPALLLTGPDAATAKQIALESQGPMVGAVGDLEFAMSTVQVESYGLLSLYSDGAFEVERPDGTPWAFGDFIDFMEKVPRTPEQTGMDGLIRFARELKGVDEFVDDLSMVEILLPPG
ncbi:SpoIIE family protein phosphatase (plasmid) [Tundrisphaera lichenicola]|uniref:SpoIIE family protein phosphatase n=1 Tax=Tundrisphaera lichenicola TaxID=2029860 RepID=UPI003EBD5E45